VISCDAPAKSRRRNTSRDGESCDASGNREVSREPLANIGRRREGDRAPAGWHVVAGWQSGKSARTTAQRRRRPEGRLSKQVAREGTTSSCRGTRRGAASPGETAAGTRESPTDDRR